MSLFSSHVRPLCLAALFGSSLLLALNASADEPRPLPVDGSSQQADPQARSAAENPARPGDPATADNPAADLPAADAARADSAVPHDLSPLGMYHGADWVVKSVMLGLLLASLVTWTLWIAKGLELLISRRRLQRELLELKGARSLRQAAAQTPHGLSASLIADAEDELNLSAGCQDKDSLKERVSFRLERLVGASGRRMSQGTGVLATIGTTAPFVGLFGTVWGIMNSFIGIAKSQTTNLAVVAPGIAEALLATALGLVAAIPAVIIYNVFSRSIAAYRAQVGDACAQVLLLVSRDLDQPAGTAGSERERPATPIAKVV